MRRAGAARWLALLLSAGGWLGTSGCVALPTLAGPAPLLVPPAPPLGPPGPFALRMRGVVHCHSRWSHDSDGELEGIVQAAQAAALDFVVLTDHYTDAGPLETPRGWYDGVLVLTGAELRAGGGSVLALDLNLPLRPRAPSGARTPQDALDRVRAAGALALIGHAERFRAWDEVEGWTGLEVANLHAMALTAPRLGTLLSALLLPPGAVLRRLVRQLPRPVLARWDALGRTRRVPGWGGADAHDNLRLPGPRGGLPLLSYHDSFRAVLNVLLVRERSAEGVREALAAGRGWVAFELSGRSEGFRFALFEAGPGGAWLADMGAELRWRPGLELRAAAPGGAQLVLLRDGRPLARARGRLVARPPGPGVYRIEAYLGAEPFILSNAIYLRSGAAAEPP